jgi:hypothetical protein
MRIMVNGVAIPLIPTTKPVIEIDVVMDQANEDLPPVDIEVIGGTLNVYVSRVKKTGNVSIHYWG